MTMPTSTAQVRTGDAGSYLRKLCQHWSHRFPVEFDASQGRIQLPEATCMLHATPDGLNVRLELQQGADDAHLRRVVEEHLQRFGFREELKFLWTTTID
jgi:uncharacterized protein